MTNRPQSYRFHQGDRVLPFTAAEYDDRLAGLRDRMDLQDIDACLFTSMHGIAYYSGFLYCAFGRPYGLVVTATDSVTISAGIDAGQPWRRCHGDNLTYTDWLRDNYQGQDFCNGVVPVKRFSACGTGRLFAVLILSASDRRAFAAAFV